MSRSSTAVHRQLGLTDEEHDRIVEILGRAPTPVELAMYAVMWSEHCSYKSSRIHLRRLPSEGPHVLVGPGENAGVIDVGDGIAVALRIESHNHPSAVEPYQGAATGVGGILRDVFTMGARPIALMDPLFFGPLDDPRSRFLFDGIVRGISGYGNSVGVPTVGGQLTFAPCYRGNPLVNVFCLGLLPVERLVLGRASGVGNLVVLLGSLTGRDGIGGVSVLASAGFDTEGPEVEDESSSKRPSVQVGDPFEEKRLIEACLSLLDQGLVVGIQDLGGAGLACATSETAARAGLGMEVDVTAVPLREPSLSPVEVMTSESQERMLAIVEPASLDSVLESCARHEVRATVIGRVIEADEAGTGHLVVREGMDGPEVASVPAKSLADEAPLYRRPLSPPASLSSLTEADSVALRAVGDGPYPFDIREDLLAMLFDPSFVYGQYDHQLFLNTVLGPGEGDATVLKLAAPGIEWRGKGLALTCDANPLWCAVDPRLGAALTVAEAALNLSCAAAVPQAVVDCMNFGNPEHPSVMWQLSEAVDGLAEACRAFGVPIVGGNVSLYNESTGVDIDPTAVVGMVGIIDRLERRPPGVAIGPDLTLVLVGPPPPPVDGPVCLGGSRFAVEVHGERGGRLPPLDFSLHARVCELVRSLVGSGAVAAVHDVSDGGLALSLAEMCCASGVGLRAGGIGTAGELFYEGPSRVVVACAPESASAGAVLSAASAAGVPASVIGSTEGESLVIDGLLEVGVARLREARASRLRDAADAVSN